MKEYHPQSPEARRKRMARLRARFGKAAIERAKREIRPLIIAKRVGIGLYDDGFIHAGNLAYLSLLALFPFFILAAAIARLLGPDRGYGAGRQRQSSAGSLPTSPAFSPTRSTEVLEGRSGMLLWFGAIVGLWTAASFIETIRDILRRAYGVKYSASFWQYRLAAMAIILGVGHPVDDRIRRIRLPGLGASFRGFGAALFRRRWDQLGFYRIVPAVTLFATFYIIFLVLTPARYRTIECRKWPGALDRHPLVARSRWNCCRT